MNFSGRRLTLFLAIVLAVLALLSGVSYSITNGQPDGNMHPYVGWVVVWDGKSPYVYLGTGTLIAPQVVLTAGHVVADEPDYVIRYVWVSFDSPAKWSPLTNLNFLLINN